MLLQKAGAVRQTQELMQKKEQTATVRRGSKPSLWGTHQLKFLRNIQPVWSLLQPKMPRNVAGLRQKTEEKADMLKRSLLLLCSHSEETEFPYLKY